MRTRGALSLAVLALTLAVTPALACRTSPLESPRPTVADNDAEVEEVSRAVLQRFEGARVIAQSGHAGMVTNLVFDDAGGHLLSVGQDEVARLWDLSSGAAAQVLAPVPGATVHALDIEAKQVALKGITDPLQVWDLETGRAFEPALEGLSYFDWTRDGGYATSFDGSGLQLWERRGNELVQNPELPAVKAVSSLEALFPEAGLGIQQWSDNLLLLSLSDGKTVLELEGLRCDHVFVPCYAVDERGRRVAVITQDGTLQAFDSGQSTPSVQTDVGEGELMGMSRDGKLVLTLEQRVAKLFDLESKRQVGSFRAGDEFLSTAALAPDGGKVALAGDAGIWVFDTRAGTELFHARTYAPVQAGALLSADGTQLLLAYDDFERQWIETWDLDLVARTVVREVDQREYGGSDSVLPRLLGWADGGRVWWQNRRGYLEPLQLHGGDGASKASSSAAFKTPRHGDRLLQPAHGSWMVLLEQAHLRVFSADGAQLGEADLPSTGMNMAATTGGFVVADAAGGTHHFEVGTDLRLVRSEAYDTNDVFMLGDGSRYEIGAREQLRRVGPQGAVENCGEPIGDVVEHLEASADGRWVVTKRLGSMVEVWDCEAGSRVHELSFPGELKAVGFADKAPVAVLTGNAGTAVVVKLDAAKHLTLASDDRDWVALSPEGMFAGSGGAAGLVAASDGVRARSIDQYALHLNRPDRLMTWWGSANAQAVAFYEAIAERRLGRAVGQAPTGPIEPPDVGLRIEQVEEGRAVVQVSATDPGGALTEVRVFVDGVPASTTEATGGAFEQQIEVELTPGRNLIELSASNAVGLESARRRVTVDPSALVQGGQLTLGVESPKGAVFSPDGESLVVLDHGGMIRVYGTDDGAPTLEARAHVVGRALASTPDGETLFTAGWDGEKANKAGLSSWRASDGERLRTYRGFDLPIYDIVATSTHVAVTAGQSRPTLEAGFSVWETGDAKPLWTRVWKGNPAWELLPVGSDRLLADVGLLGMLEWKVPGDGKAFDSLTRLDPSLSILGVSPDGTQALIEDYDHVVRLVEYETGEKLRVLQTEGERLQHAQWLGGGRVLAWGSEVIPAVIDLGTGRAVTRVGTRPANDVVVSPDATRIAALHYDGLDLQPIPTARAPVSARLFFVGVGVSDYQDDRLDLDLAAVDAQDLASTLGIGPLGQQFARPGLRAGPHSLNYWQSVLHV